MHSAKKLFAALVSKLVFISHESIDCQIYLLIYGCMEGQLNERQMQGWTDGWMVRGTEGKTDRMMDRKINRQGDERLDRQTDIQMDGLMDIWRDIWSDR
jgi:hypothetical protein